MHIETVSILFDEIAGLFNRVSNQKSNRASKSDDRRMAMAVRNCVRRIKI